MKRFAGYVLEGLVVHGAERVWIDLGLFPTLEALTTGQARVQSARPDLAETRVTVCYLDSGVSEPIPVHSARPVALVASVEATPALSA